MLPALPRSITLVCSLLPCGCGTEQIELRTSTSVPPQRSAPEEVENSLLTGEASSSGGAVVARASESGPDPGRLLLPASELPSGFDAPSPPPSSTEKGCRKIDFLFVIDDSSSMDDEQANLARSFPGFIDVMQHVLEANDFHIMVVSTGGETEEEDEPTLDAEACEGVQGAGKRRAADGEDCEIEGGLPFMRDGEPNLADTFACVAEVGTDGSVDEEPIGAMLEATSAALNQPGRCNAGFLREDAVLVVTIITDEDDDNSDGDPEDWRRLLLGVKAGNEDALVVLGLVGDNHLASGLLGGPCRGVDADGSPRLQEFVGSVGGLLGSVCAPDYTPFFQTAVGWIDSTCENFAPPFVF